MTCYLNLHITYVKQRRRFINHIISHRHSHTVAIHCDRASKTVAAFTEFPTHISVGPNCPRLHLQTSTRSQFLLRFYLGLLLLFLKVWLFLAPWLRWLFIFCRRPPGDRVLFVSLALFLFSCFLLWRWLFYFVSLFVITCSLACSRYFICVKRRAVD